MRRTNNQDSHSVIPAGSMDRFQRRGHLFIVADGMGAHAAGELASRMATELIAMHYFRASPEDAKDSLRLAVSDANNEIYQRGQQNPEFHNMGTTASTLALLPQGAIVAHVGDSRVYRLRAGVLEQLTFDHSLVWEVQASGQVHPDSALGQALPKNVITRSLGPNENVQIDMEGPFEVHPGDRFLLCSDGLSGQVDDVEIATLLDCLPDELAVQVLVDLANLRGGPDNSTVVVVSVTDGPLVDHHVPAPPSNSGDNSAFWGTVTSATATALCLMAAIAFRYLQLQGSMIITLVGAIIAGVITTTSYTALRRQTRRRTYHGDSVSSGRSRCNGGKGPYRRYRSDPGQALFDRLGKTVQELREAAKLKNWSMEWRDIDQFQDEGMEAMRSGDGKTAIRRQAEAIVETMQQLREQHDRAAGETAVEP
ncbi:serine/threonine-protein phosphatase [Roseiconus nitratireducens]|uniref:Serine/threonine-protein phosphatase n=1 Tax=Roseiconus nitratireducens TaxID=2605748 RepID=A0A5M6DB38_9BACT|nr:protein phosphatase 2C domain-containing protein [Roseiconus nitratireducens]KAA5543610.1 serine/threonine-protein phosphatase [Roseiconus nitratireducens]